MSAPPVGTVTMLFTDIEGSTRLARRLAERWPEVLAAHHALLSSAVERHGGCLDRLEGDELFAVFPDAADALRAAVEAQRQISRRPDELGGLKVRMGLHTGYVERAKAGYVGLEIHRAARVADAANGGQILITLATRALAGEDVEVEDLGDHRLKDFPAPERLFHAVVDGQRASSFPRPRTASARPSNLPADLRPLLGRSQELDRLCALALGGDRLVSVVGIGGAGKTRLAVAAATRLLDEMPGGAFLVRLAEITDPADAVPAIARTVGVGDLEADLAGRLAAKLGERATLLVLDNFEHLLSAAPAISALVAGAPQLSVLVTSQAPLRVRDETVLTIDALGVDDAVALFVRRAEAVVPGYSLAHDDRASVEEICSRLGGIPLAVELAAAGVAVFAPAELLGRLERSSDVLTTFARDAPTRQRSLRATLDWTLSCLSERERILFGCLGVFAGPAPLDAVEAVVNFPAPEALEGLVEFSLVRRDESPSRGLRFTMPQALRDFARQELSASGHETVVRDRHAGHVAALAERSRIWFSASAERLALLALEAEIRPALAWARDSDHSLYRRLAGALGLGLIRRAQTRDADECLTTALELDGESAAPWSHDAWLSTCRAYALLHAGRTHEALELIGPALESQRDADDPLGYGVALNVAAWVHADLRDDQAVHVAEEALAAIRKLGDRSLTNRALVLLVSVLLDERRFSEAEPLLTEAASSVDDPLSGEALNVKTVSGDLALFRGHAREALGRYADSMALAARLGESTQVINDMTGIALAMSRIGHAAAALEVAGIVEAAAREAGYSGYSTGLFADYEAAMAEARGSLGKGAAALATARGESIPSEQRLRRVLELAATHS